LLHREVLVLAIHEGPDFVGLNTAHAKIANVGIMVGSGSATHVFEELQDGMFGHSGHSAGGIYRHTLYQRRDDLSPDRSA